MLADPEVQDAQMLTARLRHFQLDQARCNDLKLEVEDLAAQQRQVAAVLITANHKQRLAANAAVQALLNPSVGLRPRKFKAYMDEGRRKNVVEHSQQCHMECSRMRPHIQWPFTNDPEQLEREGKAAPAEASPVDPAVSRFPVLAPQLQGQVKQLLGARFL